MAARGRNDRGTRHGLAAAGVTPLPRQSLHTSVAESLRAVILEGGLPPGSRIPELEMCRRLGVSRTPLREALKVLAAEQLVRLLPSRGAVVATVTAQEVADTFVVLEGLERLAGSLASTEVIAAGLPGIRRLQARMVEHHAAGRRTEYFQTNQAIHQRLVELAGNPVLSATHTTCARRIALARYAANYSPARWSESVREHELILAALEGGSPARLAAAMGEHVRRTAESVKAAMQAAEDRRAAS